MSENAEKPEPVFSLTLDSVLLPEGERVLAAVSGGADSMALLLALRQARREVTVAHINHGLRGTESDGDEAFVRSRCETLGIAVMTRRVRLAEDGRWVGEAEAREARYEALEALAHERGCSLIATGHTADDALETILINLLRGAGVAGLAGMPTQRSLGRARLVRPLWQATREETRRACLDAGWPWREDASNQDRRYLRNRVRAEIVPLLAEACEGGRERLLKQAARAASLLRAEHEYLAELAALELRNLTLRSEPGLLALDASGFGTAHAALQRRVLREAVRQVAGGFYSAGSEQIEEIRRHVLAGARHKVWCLENGVRVEWTGTMAGNRIRIRLVGECKKP